MNIKTTLLIWVVSFVLAALTMTSLNWLFFTSITVFFLTCLYINHEQRRFEADLDDMYGRDDAFE